MAYQYVPARDMVVQVLQADGITWTTVEGLNSITSDPAANEVIGDKETYGSAGNYDGIKMRVGHALTLAGLLSKDSITGALAPGQARITTLAAALAYAGLGQVRLRESGTTDTQWLRWPEAVFSRNASGGGNNDLRAFGATIQRNGTATLEPVL